MRIQGIILKDLSTETVLAFYNESQRILVERGYLTKERPLSTFEVWADKQGSMSQCYKFPTLEKAKEFIKKETFSYWEIWSPEGKLVCAIVTPNGWPEP